MNPPRIVFAGTPRFAIPALEWLIENDFSPVAVLTQPDRPAGRGRGLTASPVKQLAEARGIALEQPRTLKDPDALKRLAGLEPDLLITAAYGLLLPPTVLELPVHGCWNLHASLLPRWRGASPINQAILAGDSETGVSLMQMEAGLDTGPVLLQAKLPIGPRETAGTLHDRLARLAAQVLAEGLDALIKDRLPEPQPQDESRATHAPLIGKEDARLDWNLPAERLATMVRAYNPWPVAHGEIRGEPIRVFEAWPTTAMLDARPTPPGSPVTGHGQLDCLRVACGQGVLDITELQSPGKRRMTAREWLNAHPGWR